MTKRVCIKKGSRIGPICMWVGNHMSEADAKQMASDLNELFHLEGVRLWADIGNG